MNFGLKDFFMGVVHLFVIFLPGAVVVLTMLYAMPDYRDIPSDLGIGGIGTARAFQVNEVAGAFSGLAMGLNALATAILLPVLWRLVI